MSEILKSWLGKLYAWAFPSALAIGSGWLVIVSQSVSFKRAIELLTDKTGSPIFLAAVIALSICLYSVQTPMYRILEGYLLWPRRLQDWGVKREKDRKKRLLEAVEGQTGWRRGLAIERAGRLPLRDKQILPTRFGNAIRSFETYGKTRFNLDSQTLWRELCAVAPKSIISDIDDARSSVDFFVASLYLSLALTAVLLLSAVWLGSVTALFAPVSLCVAVLSHWMAVRSTDAWSSAVQALVNIGRVKLAAGLGLRLPDSLADERGMWGIVTRYVLVGLEADGIALEPYRLRAVIPPPPARGAEAVPERIGGNSEGDDEAEEGDDQGVDEDGGGGGAGPLTAAGGGAAVGEEVTVDPERDRRAILV